MCRNSQCPQLRPVVACIVNFCTGVELTWLVATHHVSSTPVVRVNFFMWFSHPQYHVARNIVLRHVSKSDYSFLYKVTPKIVFICGGDERYCQNRGLIEDYFFKFEKNILPFRAEYAWDVLSNSNKSKSHKLNALEIEKWLAELSDAVIILVESFGTVAELGAFSLSEDLRKKLLPILDEKYKNDESFINTGPVRWVDQQSSYGPSIYTNLSTILTCMPDVINRIDRHNPVYSSRSNSKINKKHFLFLLVIIVISIGPLNEEELHLIFKQAMDHQDYNISLMLSLAVGLKIISCHSFNNERYYCFIKETLNNNELTKDLLEKTQSIRAQCLSHLIKIPEFRLCLRETSK